MHRIVITSDVKQQVMTINRNAREEWQRKQAEKESTKEVNEVRNWLFHLIFFSQ